MSQELLYTSAPRGLKPGSRGFCTVLSTQGMAAPLTTALEGLSGYRPVYPTGDERADRNPVVYSHLKLQASGRVTTVLSRIADFGLDYSQRANKLAHHVVLDRTELLPGGPANLLSMRGFMRDEWSGEPTVIALKPVKRETDPPSGVCRAWQELTGDAGWAGVLAESFLQAPDRLVVLLFSPGQDILPLFNEALSLLPVERRWDVTFSTYFTGLSTGTTCTWRAIVQDSKDAHESLRFVNALRLDLTSRSLGRATGGPLVDAARSGSRPHNTQGRATSRTGPSDVVFAEAEQVQVEFSSDDPTPASFRRTAASPQPARHPQAQYAPPPQQPPDREPTYKLAPTTTSSTPQSRPGRRSLADVIEAESQRPTSGKGMWLGVGALTLALAAFLSIAFMPSPRKVDDPPANKSPVKSSGAGQQIAKIGTGNPAPPKVDRHPPASDPKPDTTTTSATPNDEDANVTTSPTASTTTTTTTTSPASTEAVKPPVSPDNGTTTATNSTKPSSPKPIKPKPILLPKKGEKKIELHRFDLASSQKLEAVQPGIMPGLLLLKPSWLPYVEHKPKDIPRKNDRALWTLIEPIKDTKDFHEVGVLIPYEATADNNVTQVICRLVSNSDDHTQWLGWYRLRVLSPKVGEPPVNDFAFTEFPLSVELKERLFVKKSSLQSLQWKLPDTAVIAPGKEPELVLDRLRIAIGKDKYPLNVGNRSPEKLWRCSLESFALPTLESFGIKSIKPSEKLAISIKTASGTAGPAIELVLEGAHPFLNAIESDLNQRFKQEELAEESKNGPFAVIWRDDEKKSGELVPLLENFSVDKAKNVDAIINLLKSTDNEAAKQLNTKPKENRKNELDEAKNKLPELIGLYESVKRYQLLVASLDKVSVVSARIYYELTDTLKYSPGKPIEKGEIVEVVDVVNFDDAGVGDQ